MRGTLPLWLLALALKYAGAAWDVSWHFEVVRETISPPHLLNLLGDMLGAVLLVYEWRHRTPEREFPLKLVAGGIGLFLLAIPIDEWWHRAFGLDLTTWSPSHLLLFYGTALSLVGLFLLARVDLGWAGRQALRAPRWREAALLALFALFAAEALLFPLAYNEYTTIGAVTAVVAPETMDPQLVAMAASTDDPVFLGTPKWLYPVYCIAAVTMVAVFLRRALGAPGVALGVLGGFALLRFASDAILGAAGYPRMAVPWQYVGMGIAAELAFLAPVQERLRAALAAIGITAAAYAYWTYAPAYVTTVPIGGEAWAFALGAALLAATVAWWTWVWLERRPVPEHVVSLDVQVAQVKAKAIGMLRGR